MAKDDWKSLRLKEDLINKAEARYKTKGIKTIAFSRWIALLLEAQLARYDILDKHVPNIQLISSNIDSIILKDKDRLIEVQINGIEPYCKHCKKDNCKHAYYALITPELALIERAWRDLNPRPTG